MARAQHIFTSLFILLTAACDGGGDTGAKASGDDAATLAAQDIWQTRCVNCHGSSGKGDGPGAVSLDPKPRSFADPAWQGRASDDQIRAAILGGGMAVQMSPAMPANPDLEAKPEVVSALILEIRKLQQ